MFRSVPPNVILPDQFEVALVTDNTMLIEVSTPILGVALLTAVAVRAPSLLSRGWAA